MQLLEQVPLDLPRARRPPLGAGHSAVLERTQAADGHWPQNFWLDGTPYWQGIQLDETSYPMRFGLRAPDDPHVVKTVAVYDAILRADTPFGPVWHRYNHDGYGEKADGRRTTVPASVAAGRC